MVILLSVLLVCNLAVDGLASEIPRQTRTCISSSVTTDTPFRGSDEIESNLAFTPCADEKNHCAAFGHPV